MRSEWQTLTVDQIRSNDNGSIAIGPFGSRMKADTYVASGVPVIRGNNISDTRAFSGEFVYVSEKTADALKTCNVFAGDLVFPHRGAIGLVGIVPEGEPSRFILSTSLMKLTCDREVADPLFVFYYFRSVLGRNALLEHASTVGTPGIGQPLTSLRSVKLPIPPLTEQRTIAHILGTLDEKIELNRRMSETLEAMAHTLFKAWFVDFEPVRIKMEGRWQRGQSLPGLPAHLYDLFPDRLVESEFGKIPEGWRHSTIGEEVTVCGGATPSTKEQEFWEGGQHHWATPKDLSALKFPVLLDTDRKITDAGLAKISSGLLPVGTVLLSSRAPIGYLAIAEVPTAINQGFIAMKCDGVLPNVFVLSWCRESMDAIVGNANGSTFQEISKSNFRPLRILVPSDPVLTSFTRLAGSVYQQLAENERESLSLAQLRDTLLPKLISGELRVPDAERIVGAAV